MRPLRILCATLGVLLLLVAAAVPLSPARAAGPPEFVHATRSDVSPPLRSIKPGPPQKGHAFPTRHPNRTFDELALEPKDRRRQSVVSPAGPTPTLSNWDGVSNVNGVVPPDTNGDVGPNDYVQWVNLSFQIWDKQGNSLYGPAAGNTLWSGFGGVCDTTNQGDPVVLYDRAADRWLMAQFAFGTRGGNPVAPYYECVAVSTTGDPTGSYYRYAFRMNATSNYFPDYPKLGVWPDGYYLSTNNFNGNTFAGAGAYVLDRSKMLTGDPNAGMISYQLASQYEGILPANLTGSTPPPSGSPGYFGSVDTSGPGTGSTFQIWKLHPDFATPANSTLTGPTNVPVSPYTFSFCGSAYSGSCIPQPGTSQTLDPLSDRLLNRLEYRNFGDHESLVATHTVNVGSGGTDQAGMRWYEIRAPGSATPDVHQQGTFAPADGVSRWMGSIAMDRYGNIALGYSASSASGVHPSVRYTGRLAGDPLGQMTQGEQTLVSGAGSQTGYPRWGDYSSMSVDPTDDSTFWYTQEYYSATSSAGWRTRIGSFKLASPPAAPTVSTSATDRDVHLSWTTPADGGSAITGYRIYRATSAGNETLLTTTGTGTSYDDTAVTNGTTYYYRVAAVNDVGEGARSAEVSSTPPAFWSDPQGSWVGTYGSDGYALGGFDGSSDVVSMPNAGVTVLQGGRYTWTNSTSNVSALQGPDQASRRATTWVAGSDLRLRLNFPGAYKGALHLYALDWDNGGRRETIAVNDGSSTQTVHINADFSHGAWTSFPLNVPAGATVTIDVTRDAGNNAVLSGIFLGDAGSSPPLQFRAPPQGDWVGNYGSDGYALGGFDGSSDVVSMPNAGVTVLQGGRYTWTNSTSNVSALQGPDQASRRATTWVAGTDLRLRLNFPTAYSGTLHLYALDWGNGGRRETIAVNDGSSTQTVHINADFSQGAWTSFPLNVGAGASVTIDVTRDAGDNAVLSGIFLGDAGTPPPIQFRAPPQGSWVGNYGSDGYTLGGFDGGSDVASMPNANLSLLQGGRYTWSSSTSNVTALQSPDQSTRRATCWVAGTDLRLRLSFPAVYKGTLHLYALDWGNRGRRETIAVDDGSSTQTVHINADFSHGAWTSFPLNVSAGSTVTIDVTKDAGDNAVLSGVFLG